MKSLLLLLVATICLSRGEEPKVKHIPLLGKAHVTVTRTKQVPLLGSVRKLPLLGTPKIGLRFSHEESSESRDLSPGTPHEINFGFGQGHLPHTPECALCSAQQGVKVPDQHLEHSSPNAQFDVPNQQHIQLPFGLDVSNQQHVQHSVGLDVSNQQPVQHSVGLDVSNQQNIQHTVSHEARLNIPNISNIPQDISNNILNLEELLEEEWKAFKMIYNKSYATSEIENVRREIFLSNRAKIAKFNQEYGDGKRSFVQQLNPYGDMLFHEFNRNLNGFNRSRPESRELRPSPVGSTFIPSANVIFPNNMDWRQVGAVSSVKSQGLCAGCWAFAAAGALEGQNYRKTGNLVELSAQNLIDCTTPNGNDGCKGGNINPAYEYVRDNPGLDTEASYPYEARDAECRFKEDSVGGYCSGWVDIGEGDEKGLEVAVATIGPVACAIDASKETLQFYSEGVYFDPECGNSVDSLNHAVLVVGFGTEPDGQKYWLVKNSYGQQWGTGGYIKMAKDRNNHCGIASSASYPLV